MKSNTSNKVPSAFSDDNVAKLNKVPGGNARRVSGVDRGKYLGSHDIVPPGTGEYDSVININDRDDNG